MSNWKTQAEALASTGLSWRKIARSLGLPKSTVSDHLREHCKVSTVETSKAEVFSIVTSKSSKVYKDHVVIPDTQVKKGDPVDHLRWAGEYCVAHKPEVIVHIGDHADMPSLSSYDKGKRTAEGKRVNDDIEAAIKGMEVLLRPIKDEQERQLREDGKISWKPRMVLTLGNHECLLPDTEVVVKGGFKNITEVTLDDEVLTMNKDGTSEWSKPSLVFTKDYVGDMYNWESQSLSTSCTPSHRFYRVTSGGNVRVDAAEDVPKNFTIISSCSTKPQGVLPFSKEELMLSGWLCTDSYHPKNGNVVSLYQRASTAHKIRDLLDKMGISYREATRKRDITHICGKALLSECEDSVEFFVQKDQIQHLGVTSNKEVPSWVPSLSDEDFSLFLESVVDADGSIPTKAVNSRVVYGAKMFCDSLQSACVSHGYSASLTEYREGHWRVNINKRSTRKQDIVKKTITSYAGPVWCLETPNSNFFIRRGHKVHLTGNCRITRHVDANPELHGFLSMDSLRYKDFGWEVYDFLEPAVVDGVTYCHFMANPMTGKPYGGSTLNILKQVGESFTMGHKQTLDVATRFLPSSGRQQWGVIAGAFYQHDEDYKGPQGNKHWRGIIHKRRVTEGSYDPEIISLERLKYLYGKKEKA